jgi:hypothetical protein
MSKTKIRLFIFVLIGITFSSCAETMASIGYFIGCVFEVFLVLLGVGLAIWIIVLIIAWLFS